ncbi:hypothetical protein [Helicovermis profundi]|uniref:Uncharacterized protein n=1 Tax=Helicovermis profundi TaxID=3065157 RepID=A0AAU9ECY3_9FIRM|nr:hypothetical protein HLPR_15700 [Clostridia bacterium S502]
MKKMVKVISVIIVIILFAFILNSYQVPKRWLINLITNDERIDKIEYVSVYSNGNIEMIDKFKSDDIEIYTADSDCYESYISDNEVLNKLKKIVLIDSDGNTVDNDEIITEIFQIAEEIKHDIWKFQIIMDDDKYFVIVELNVNWQSPCDFYEYDQTQKKLILFHRFDDVDIIGLSLTKGE